MGRLRFATIWLGGCSGCHMSFLDTDEFLLELAGMADLVYTPLVDVKEYPENVDLVLIEGAVGNDEHKELLLKARARTKTLVALGDCAISGNVTGLRNLAGGAQPSLENAYITLADTNPGIPALEHVLPVITDPVVPLHRLVQVDAYIPGCPPDAKRIRHALEGLLSGAGEVLVGNELRPG